MIKVIVVASLLFLFLATSVNAQLADSPSPTLLGNLKRTGLSPYTTDIETPALKWKFDLGNGVESSPAIGPDGTIYVAAFSDNFYALNPDGTEKWRFTREGEHFRTSPTLDKDGTVYIIAVVDLRPLYNPALDSDDDFGIPKLYAIKDGKLKWEFVTGGLGSGIMYSPAIGSDGTVYVISLDSLMPGAEGGDRFWAVNPDGTAKWYFETGGAMYSAPAIDDDGTIYIGCVDGNLYAINPDGTEKWRFNTGDDAVERNSIFDAVPSIGPDGTVYAGAHDKYLYAINPDGTEKWRFKMLDIIEATPSIGPDGTIYAGAYAPSNDKNLYALTPDGKEKWRFETGEGVYGAPVIDANGILFFGSYDGNLYSLNPDGTERWRFETNGGITMPPVIDSEGTVYFGSWDNHLYAISGHKDADSSQPDYDQTSGDQDEEIDSDNRLDPPITDSAPEDILDGNTLLLIVATVIIIAVIFVAIKLLR